MENEYLKNRLNYLNKKYSDIDEVIIGGKKQKFYFPFDFLGKDNLNKIGYKGKKAMKIRCTKNELEVADLIMKNPHKNLIKIYNVDKKNKEIIMEKFATVGKGPGMKLLFPENNEINKYLNDIKLSLKQLKKLNIAHIDIKKTNTGYSKKDKVWKIFDFDISGIYNKKNKWDIKPIYEINIGPYIKYLKPNEIDDYLFKYYSKFMKKTENGLPYDYLKLIKKSGKKTSRKSKSHKSSKTRKSVKKSPKSRKSRKSVKKSRKTRKSTSKSSCKGLKRKSCLKKSRRCSWIKKTKRAGGYCRKKYNSNINKRIYI